MAAACVGVLAVLLRTASAPSPAGAVVERLRAAGLPTTAAELDRWYGTPPDAQNLAIPVLEAAQGLQLPPNTDTNVPWLGRAELPAPGQPLDERLRSRLEGLIRTNGAALALARSAVERPQCRYPVPLAMGLDVPLRHLGPVRQLVKTLNLETLLATDQHRADLAVSNLVTALRLCDSLAQEPIAVSVIVALGTYPEVAQATERLTSRCSLTETQLHLLEQAWSRSLTDPVAERVLLGEIAFYESVRRLGVVDAVRWIDVHSGSDGRSVWEETRLVGRIVSGGLKHEYAVLVECLDAQRAIVLTPFPKRLQEERIFERQWAPRLGPDRLPVLWRVAEVSSRLTGPELRASAMRQCVLTSLAVERYRLRHAGALPERLEDLVPDYCAAVPEDPVDGKPLRYRRSGVDYMIYSVGEDGVDHGGEAPRRRGTGGKPKGVDWPFAVRRSGAGQPTGSAP